MWNCRNRAKKVWGKTRFRDFFDFRSRHSGKPKNGVQGLSGRLVRYPPAGEIPAPAGHRVWGKPYSRRRSLSASERPLPLVRGRSRSPRTGDPTAGETCQNLKRNTGHFSLSPYFRPSPRANAVESLVRVWHTLCILRPRGVTRGHVTGSHLRPRGIVLRVPAGKSGSRSPRGCK